MRINPELYAKFKLVGGDSNNERMAKLLNDSSEKYSLIRLGKFKDDDAASLRSMYHYELALNKTLASALVVSIAVSVCSVAYVCVVNGWFA